MPSVFLRTNKRARKAKGCLLIFMTPYKIRMRQSRFASLQEQNDWPN